MDISGRRVVVTGAARGMGHHFAKRFVEEGARVVLCDLDPATAAEAAAAIGAHGVGADVSQEAGVEALFDAATAHLGGPPDVLVNNAGILRDGLLVKVDRDSGDVTGLSKDKWDAVIATNLTGPFLCTRAFAVRAIRGGVRPAVVVNMSSVARSGNAGQSNYSAAKAGLASDTMVWAKELARHGIRVGAIAPGFIRTPMLEAMRPEMLEKVISPVPLRRLGEPEEIWETVRFIVRNEYFTGRVIEVDGGLVL